MNHDATETIYRCVHCMGKLDRDGLKVCPYCGRNPDPAFLEQASYCMRPMTILRGRYLVGKSLGHGGFGITYIGLDLSLDIRVAVKECFPDSLVTRDSNDSNTVRWSTSLSGVNTSEQNCESFLREARKMARIKDISGVVRVLETFVENNTAYIIMDFVDGMTVKDMLYRDGKMTPTECVEFYRPIMHALSEVHKLGFIHRDISPDNIMIDSDGKLKILDLGAAKDLTGNIGGPSMNTNAVIRTGFSPIEQYSSNAGNIGAWTDVYALAATMYYSMTGKRVADSLDRINGAPIDFDSKLFREPPSETLINALKNGLEIRSGDRTQSMAEFEASFEDKKPEHKKRKSKAKPDRKAKTKVKPEQKSDPVQVSKSEAKTEPVYRSMSGLKPMPEPEIKLEPEIKPESVQEITPEPEQEKAPEPEVISEPEHEPENAEIKETVGGKKFSPKVRNALIASSIAALFVLCAVVGVTFGKNKIGLRANGDNGGTEKSSLYSKRLTESEEVVPVSEDNFLTTKRETDEDGKKLSPIHEFSDVSKVSFRTNLINAPDDAKDLSDNGSGGVKAWREGYELIIAANGKVCGRDLSYLFDGFSNMTEVDLSGLDTSQATDMTSMFSNCSSVTWLDVSDFNTSKVTSMSSMFYKCSALDSINVRSFDTSNVTSMYCMFYKCYELNRLSLSKFDTHNVTNMAYMFAECTFTSLDVSSFDTSNVTDMYCMFYKCTGLKNLDVSGFDTSKVTKMGWMFGGCSSLEKLDLSGFIFTNVAEMGNFTRDCPAEINYLKDSSTGSEYTPDPSAYSLSVSFDDSGIVTLRWLSTNAEEYYIYVAEYGDGKYMLRTKGVPSKSLSEDEDAYFSHPLSGLENGKYYSVFISDGKTVSGKTLWFSRNQALVSDPVNAVTYNRVQGVNGNIYVSWQPIEGAGSYKVFIRSAGDDGFLSEKTMKTTSSNMLLAGLEPGEYEIRVGAYSDRTWRKEIVSELSGEAMKVVIR